MECGGCLVLTGLCLFVEDWRAGLCCGTEVRKSLSASIKTNTWNKTCVRPLIYKVMSV